MNLEVSAETTPVRASIAPAWHTAVVLAVMLGISLLSARFNSVAAFSKYGRSGSYLLAMAVEWATVAFIWWGESRRGRGLSELIGGRWAHRGQVFRDLGIGVAFVLVFGGAVQALTYLLKATPPPGLTGMLPQSLLELLLWVPLSLTGGFCEEVIFRGYLQRQFSAFAHSLIGGIVLQGIIFGASHGYQGWKLMAIIAFYGVCFGWLAHWRRSLRPGMFGHALQDLAGGFLAHFQPR